MAAVINAVVAADRLVVDDSMGLSFKPKVATGAHLAASDPDSVKVTAGYP
jgi:hypothetical protein